MVDEPGSLGREPTSAESLRQVLSRYSTQSTEYLLRWGVVRQMDVGPVLDVWVNDEIYAVPLSEEQAEQAALMQTLDELLSFLDALT